MQFENTVDFFIIHLIRSAGARPEKNLLSLSGVKRNFWLHAMCACTEWYSTYQIRWENWWFGSGFRQMCRVRVRKI